MQLGFANFVLDPARRELTRGSDAIAIGPLVQVLLPRLDPRGDNLRRSELAYLMTMLRNRHIEFCNAV